MHRSPSHLALAAALAAALVTLATSSLRAAEPPAENPAEKARQIEFFETKIRPLLSKSCFKCHSAKRKSPKGGLRLDTRSAMLAGGDSGRAIVPGKPNESLLIESVRYEAGEMPPSGKLAAEDIAALEHWVEVGAPWPDESAKSEIATKEGYDWSAAKKHWSWTTIRRTAPPPAEPGDRIRNPIDQFVVAGLHRQDLSQPKPAPAATFVRRAFVGLVGFPPTPEQQKDWVARLSPNANGELDDRTVRELVDTLLEMPQYGERWGRHWLDVARYSDGGGWSQDNRSHPQAWRYRDWVVQAFNADMPYDEFVRCQITGDTMGRTQAIGTGFFALGPSYSSDGGDPDSVAQAKGETLDDRVDTFSRAFLGLTVSCARCHDHKFDPIPTQDYYSLAGIFSNTGQGDRPISEPKIAEAFDAHKRRVEELDKKKIRPLRDKAKKEKRELTEAEKAQIKSWEDELKKLRAATPPKPDVALTLHDRGSADMKVALRGNLRKPGEVAPRRFLRILSGEKRTHFQEGSGRKQLAEAVADPENPLTARVIVNRIWLQHFGRALVRTPSNFGTLGETPTHPELLDWLASEFVAKSWSIKNLHRLIMSSATYRASSVFVREAFDQDGDNRSIWRMNPRRMDVEAWRDSLLAVTGELDATIGGPAIDNIVGSRRRTLYAKVSRNNPYSSDKFLRLFDFPIPRATNAKRTSNVIPQQFLFMLNSQFMIDRAKALAVRLEKDAKEPNARIARAYALLYGREPTEREMTIGATFLSSEATTDKNLTRWQQYCQVLLSANEFMYIR